METQFDEWFKLEQEKLEKKFAEEIREQIMSGEDFDVPKKEFEHEFKKLFTDFEKKNYNQIKIEKWKKLLIVPVKKINKGMDEFIKAFREE